jgi:hypothetical protein
MLKLGEQGRTVHRQVSARRRRVLHRRTMHDVVGFLRWPRASLGRREQRGGRGDVGDMRQKRVRSGARGLRSTRHRQNRHYQSDRSPRSAGSIRIAVASVATSIALADK